MRILLLAGGGGTRLWPLSTEERPKQFLALVSKRSLFADTYERIAAMASDVWVATAARYVDLVAAELPAEFPRARILAESARRNSGPAILRAALRFAADGDPVTAAVPSDHSVPDAEAFRQALTRAADLADRASVVVLGILPSRPETEYGYLECSSDDPALGSEVLRFVEKPTPAKAEECIRSGYLWNAGIFVFRPSRLLAEAGRVAPGLLRAVERVEEKNRAGDTAGAESDYAELPAISIDHAVMERAQGVRAVPLAARWSDVGSWRSVREMRRLTDPRGNLIVSDVPVLAPGVSDCAIVVGPDGVLVLPFEREGELRDAVDRLRVARPDVPAKGRKNARPSGGAGGPSPRPARSGRR